MTDLEKLAGDIEEALFSESHPAIDNSRETPRIDFILSQLKQVFTDGERAGMERALEILVSAVKEARDRGFGKWHIVEATSQGIQRAIEDKGIGVK